MKKLLELRRLAVVLAAVAVIAAACGAGDDQSEGAPLAPDVAADEPADLSSINDGPAGAPNEPVTPGVPWSPEFSMSVSEILSGDVTGAAAVKGFLVVDAGGARLCEVLAESYPPQCGGGALPITNYEEFLGVPVQEAHGVTWTDDVVSFLGLIVDGTLVVDPTIASPTATASGGPTGGSGTVGGGGLPDLPDLPEGFPAELVLPGAEVVAIFKDGGGTSVTFDLPADTDDVIATYAEILGQPAQVLDDPEGAQWVTSYQGSQLTLTVAETGENMVQINVMLI
jgi:hypothetical protein